MAGFVRARGERCENAKAIITREISDFMVVSVNARTKRRKTLAHSAVANFRCAIVATFGQCDRAGCFGYAADARARCDNYALLRRRVATHWRVLVVARDRRN